MYNSYWFDKLNLKIYDSNWPYANSIVRVINKSNNFAIRENGKQIELHHPLDHFLLHLLLIVILMQIRNFCWIDYISRKSRFLAPVKHNIVTSGSRHNQFPH